jgi:hypothetical protein
MYQYVIYPDHWVVRQFRIGPGTIEPGTVITAESLEEARAYVPTLLTRWHARAGQGRSERASTRHARPRSA